jgi:hypothetical protein
MYNDGADQMELTAESGSIDTMFIVPPWMKDGDTLTPFQFRVLPSRVTFYFFGRYDIYATMDDTSDFASDRYNAAKDLAEFVVAGPPGYKYKIGLADGNSPYGWKIKKHGLTRSSAASLSFVDRAIGFCVEKFLVMVGKEASPDYFRDIVQADAFAMEEIIGVPMAMVRLSEKHGLMDAKEKCIGPWAFYGPSLPETFCRCRLKLLIYPPTGISKALDTIKAGDPDPVPLPKEEAP